MAQTAALDVSQWQGAEDFTKISEPIVFIRASYFYQGKGLFDAQCTADYYNAKKNGKAVGLYHFAGGADPVAEADFFLKAVAPLEDSDVLALDWEIELADPVSWCQKFLERIIAKTGTIPLIYMDTDRENRFNWDKVVAMNVGLWIADYRFTPAQNVPVRHWKSYVMHQYSDGGGKLDHDMFFGTVAQFKAYGWHAGKAASKAPAPSAPAAPPKVVAPAPTPTTVPSTPAPPAPLVVTPAPITSTATTGLDNVTYSVTGSTSVTVTPTSPLPKQSLFDIIMTGLNQLIRFLKSFKR